MRATNINIITHQWIKEAIDKESIVVDATMGNGHDTLFLSEHAQFVYAFDISAQALEITQKRLQHQTNVQLIHDSHEHIQTYINHPIDGIVFNCGYLPNSDHTSVTQSHTTLAALDGALTLLKPQGWLCITLYLGHPQGPQEAHDVKRWLDTHTKILKTYTYPNIEKAPIAYFALVK